MIFVTREEWQQVRESESERPINEVLSRLYNKAVEDTLRKLPEVISRMLANTAAIQSMTKAFFEKNKDFEAHKPTVAAVVQEVESANPGLNYDKILELAEPVIREKINAVTGIKDFPLWKPEAVSLNGNGIL